MFLPNWHQRIKLSYSNRGLRRRRRTRTRRLESLEPRTLLSVTPAAVTITPTEVMDFTTTVATFTADDSGPFMATIDWGDGSTATVGNVTPAAGGGYDVSGSYAYNEDGPYSLKVTIVDEHDSTTATVTSTAQVAEATTGEAPFSDTAGSAISVAEGQTLTALQVATFDDFETSDPGQFRATIDWGDGTSSTGTISTLNFGGSFQVVGDHVYTDELSGNYTVTIEEPEADFTATPVSNSVSVSESDAFTVSPTSIAAIEGKAFSGTVGTFSDSYAGQVPSDLTASIDWGDGSMTTGTITGGSGSFTINGDHTYADEGSFPLVITVLDDAPGTAAATISSTASVGEADAFTPTGTAATLTGTEGTAVGGTLAVFADTGYPTNDAADLSATVAWGDGHTTTVSPTTAGDGSFTVNGTHTYSEDGGYTITTTINDDSPGTATATATAVANIAETDLSLSPAAATLTSTEGTAFTGTVAILSDLGSLDPTSDYTATIDWGDGTTSAGTLVPTIADVVYRVVGGHTYADEGTFTVTVTATETSAVPAATATTTFMEAVSEGDSFTPIATTITAAENHTFTGAVGTFSDGYAGQVPSDLTAAIDWGDGTITSGTVTGGSGSFTIGGAHAYADEGSFPLLITVLDDAPGTAAVTISSTANVTEADAFTVSGTPATLTGTEGTAVSGTLAIYADTGYPANDAADLSATVDWGDGQTTTVTPTTAGDGNFTVNGTHTYADDGSYTITTTINDDSPGTATATTTAVANIAETDLSLSPAAATLISTEGTAFTGTVAIVSDPGSFDPTSDYTATIDWGDGMTSAGTIVLSVASAVYRVVGGHTYADEGTFTVTVTATETNAVPAATTTTTIMETVAEGDTVTPVPTAIAATEGHLFSGTVGTFTDSDTAQVAGDWTASVDWGDGTITTGTVTGGSGSFTINGGHTYADEGSYTVLASFFDGAPSTLSATITSTATVDEGDSVMPNAVTIVPTEGQTFSGIVGTFTDPGNPLQTAGDWTATVDWGDGTMTAGTLTGPNRGLFTISGQHTYADEGTFTVLASFSDDAPGTFSATITSTATVLDTDSFLGTGTTLSGTEGVSLKGTVATFSDSNPAPDVSDFVAHIAWGDGTSSVGTVTGGTGADLTVTGSHAYADDGVYTITTILSDPGGASAAATSTATVSESAFGLTAGLTLTATEGKAVTGFQVATFLDPDSPDPASDYAATIDWGDGVTDAGTITGSGGSFTVSGNHTYADERSGSYSVSVSEPAANFTFGPVSASLTVVEGDTLTPLAVTTGTVVEGQALGGKAAVFDDASYPNNDPADFSGTFDWGDGTTYTTGDGKATITSDGAGHFTLSVSGHSYADEGVYTVVATIADNAPGTASLSQTGTLTVTDADSLTASAVPVTLVGTEGTAVSGTLAIFSDTGYPTNAAADFSAVVDWGDGTSSTESVSASGDGKFTVGGSHSYADEGGYTLTISIADDAPGTATATTTAVADIAPASLSLTPAITAIALAEGTAFSAPVAVLSDPGSTDQASDYQATIDWGDGATAVGLISGSKGVYSVDGTHTYADEGSYTVTVTASETGTAPVATATLAAIISEGDALVSGPSVTAAATEGATFTGTALAVFRDTDYPGNVPADFTATVDWGDGTTTAGILTGGGGAFTVSGSHAYAEEGVRTATIVLTDDAPGTASATATAEIDVADAPLSAMGTTIATTEGATFSGSVAMFTDADPGATASDYKAAIDWGDGLTTAGTISGDAKSSFQVSGIHVYAEEGVNSMTVIISDAGGSKATAASTANVADATLNASASTVTATEGASFTATIASFTDANPGATPGDFKANIAWGDGTSSTGSVAADGSGGFKVTGTHAYAEEGTDTAVVTIADTGGSSATVDSTMLVNDAPLTATGATIAPTEGSAFSGIVATFTDADPNGAASDYTTTIDWGDGAKTAGTIAPAAGGGFQVIGTHTYTQAGSYSIKATITDVGSVAPEHTSSPLADGIVLHSTVTATGKATVSDAPLAATAVTVVATEGTSANLVVATFTDADPNGVASDYTATISWGDGATTAGTVAPAASGGFQVSATHTYLEEGGYAPTVVIRDVGDSAATADSTTQVADAALSATATTLTATQFTPFTGTIATFSDADPNGTVSDYSATIDWGDGSTSSGTIAAAGTGFQVNGSHTYAQAGTFTVTVDIADVGGSSATAQSTADVAAGTMNGSAILINGFEFTPLRNVPVATFIKANGAEPAGNFQATIDWGDGTSSTGTVSESGGTYAVTSSHEYLDEGTFTVSVRVSDAATSVTITTAAAILEELLPNGTQGTPNQRFVQEIYRDLLHRAVDPAGLEWWTSLLDNGVSRQDVASGIIASSMGNELGADMVTGIFEKFLGRDPDPAGMAFWIMIISQRETVEDTEANVVGTPEFFYLAGSTDTGFITRLYRLALGRDPEQSAIDHYSTLLDNGVTREQVAEIVLNSLEYRQDEIRGYYQSPDDENKSGVGTVPFIDDIDFFDRPADTVGLQTFSIEAERDTLDQQIWAEMLGSDEFFAKIGG